jgi:hypothetical protein
MDIFGRTGFDASAHCIIMMAESAGAAAHIAPKKRPVFPNQSFRHLLKKDGTAGPGGRYSAMKRAGKDMAAYYKYVALRPVWEEGFSRPIYGNHKEKIEKIGRRGLARRSWMWGLSAIGGRDGSRPIAGTFSISQIHERDAVGLIKQNKLKYIVKAMPSGWEDMVAQKAENKIMKQAAMKIERDFERAAVRSRWAAESYARNFVPSGSFLSRSNN